MQYILSKIGINQDEVVVNLYYSRIANINVKHLDEYTGKPVSGDANGVNIRANFGDAYSSFDIGKKDITGYDYSKTVSTPTDITGNINTKSDYESLNDKIKNANIETVNDKVED